MIFAAVHESGNGTELPIPNVRSSVANGVKRTRYAQCEFFVREAIACGVNHIDTSV
jgi:diketogulonate reductase-like aldo/keto reductase